MKELSLNKSFTVTAGWLVIFMAIMAYINFSEKDFLFVTIFVAVSASFSLAYGGYKTFISSTENKSIPEGVFFITTGVFLVFTSLISLTFSEATMI